MPAAMRTGLASLMLCSAPAWAVDGGGFYAGGSIGEFTIDFSDPSAGISFDDSDTGFRIFGGWQFNEFFAVEGGYVDGGSPNETFDAGGIPVTVDIEVTGFDLLLRGTLPLGESLFAFAEAGMLFWDADVSASGGGSSSSLSDSGEDAAYGAGFGFNFGDNAAARIEYVLYDISDADAEAILASIPWRFR